MTPKEKAQELVNKFLPHVDCDVRFEDSEFKNAKKCALISINEIIKVSMDNLYSEKYWQEVKQQINQL